MMKLIDNLFLGYHDRLNTLANSTHFAPLLKITTNSAMKLVTNWSQS